MSLAVRVSHELDLVDLSGKSENKFNKVLEQFADALEMKPSQLIAKTIAQSSGNAFPRMNEATNDKLKGFFFGICNFDNESEYSKPALLDQAKKKVDENRFESVVYLRKSLKPGSTWSVYLVVAKEHSPILEVVNREWPGCQINIVPSPLPLAKNIKEVLRFQLEWVSDWADPKMQERGTLLNQISDRLKHELHKLNLGTEWSAEPSNGKGLNARVPWVRVSNLKFSPRASVGFYSVLLFSEDGSKAYLSLNQATTIQKKGKQTLIDSDEIRRRSDEIRAKFIYDGSGSIAESLSNLGEVKETIFLGESPLARQYSAGNIIAYEYLAESVVSEHSIVCQLDEMVKSLHEVYKGAGPVVTQDDLTLIDSLGGLVQQTFWPEEELRDVLNSLQDKSPQVVLEGPPGTGKTYVAKKLAEHLVGAQPGESSPYITIVQFHPSYGYEEFVEGLRPEVSDAGLITFANKPGPILEISRKIKEDGKPHVLIIDELNRANIPRVFGELMYLLEYRDESIDLMLGEKFELPEDLYIIATMNTADKSIRIMDTALRRRFDFFSVMPSVEILRAFYGAEGNENRLGEDLFQGFTDLNLALREEVGDDGHLIGHSFFMTELMDRSFLESRWKRQIGPQIREYFFDRQAPEAEFTLERFWPNS